jgi:hypothetical protein
VGGESTAEQMEFDPQAVARSGVFSRVRLHEFANEQSLDLEGLIGRSMSASYVPKSGPAAEKLVGLLRDLHAHHVDSRGRVTLVYTTQVYLADRA